MDLNNVRKRIDRLLETIEEEQSSHQMELTPERIEHLNLQCYAFAIEFLKKKGIINLGYIDHHYNNGREKWEQYGNGLNELVDYADEMLKDPNKYATEDKFENYLAGGMLSLFPDAINKYASSDLVEELKTKKILIKGEYSNNLELNEDKLRNLNGTESTSEEKTNS